MLKEFLNDGGSVLAIILLVYSYYVMKAVQISKMADFDDVPLVFKHHSSGWFVLLAYPGLIWSAIYIGLYFDWIAGIVSFLALQFTGKWGVIIIGVYSKKFIGYHYFVACVAMPIGYFLSISTLII